METTLDTIKELLKRNGGSVNFDNPKGILLDYEFSEEGEEYAVYAKEIFLKGDHIYAKCASCLAESELYEPSFTEEYRVNSTNVENVKDQIYRSLVKLIEKSYLTEDVLLKIAESKDIDVLAALVQRCDCPAEIINKLAFSESSYVRELVARHSNLNSFILWQMSLDDNPMVRANVARNPNVSIKILDKLASDSAPDVLYAVATNLLTPTESLAKMIEDISIFYRRYIPVAKHPNASTDILTKLAKCSNTLVKCDVAENPNTSVETLDLLAHEEDVAISVARNPNASENTLNVLIESQRSIYVREEIAKHPNVNVCMLKKLAKDEYDNVRIAVARNHRSTSQILSELSMDYSYKVRLSVAENPNVPKKVLNYLMMKDGIKPSIDEQKEISKVYYAYLNCPAYEAAKKYPLTKEGKNGIEYQIARLKARLDDEEFKEHTRFGDSYSQSLLEDDAIKEEIQRLENYQETTFNIIDKYSSLSEDERKVLNLESKLLHHLDCLLMIRNDVHCLTSLRLEEQECLMYDKKVDYSRNLDNCQAVYPGTQNKLFSCSPYIVTDIKFSTPPYADGQPLDRCPGWQGCRASYGHIDSITIKNGKDKTVTYFGEQIDNENNLVFELKDMTVKYKIETGEARFFPHPKESETEAQRQAQQQKQQEPKRCGMHR